MSDDQFVKLEAQITKLTEHVVAGFAQIEERFRQLETQVAQVATKERMNTIYRRLDSS